MHEGLIGNATNATTPNTPHQFPPSTQRTAPAVCSHGHGIYSRYIWGNTSQHTNHLPTSPITPSPNISHHTGCIKLIKHVWKQPRPSLNCQHLNTCDTYGMPSSHTQLAFFQCTWALLVFLFRTRHRPVHTKQHTTHRMSPSTCIDLLCVAAGWCIALLVGISRVQLGYHSVLQVAVGALAGLLTAGVWFALLVYGARPLHTALVQHGGGGCGVVVGSVLARVLCIRDTLDVGGDVVCVERDLLVGVAALGKKGE